MITDEQNNGGNNNSSQDSNANQSTRFKNIRNENYNSKNQIKNKVIGKFNSIPRFKSIMNMNNKQSNTTPTTNENNQNNTTTDNQNVTENNSNQNSTSDLTTPNLIVIENKLETTSKLKDILTVSISSNNNYI